MKDTLLTMLRDFLAAQQSKADAKSAWTSMNSSDEGYYGARDAFRSADDRCETLFEQIVPSLQAAQANDELEDAIEALDESEAGMLRKLLSDRGLHMLLDAAPTSLAGSITRYRKASAIFTAARELNARRRQLDAADFEECLSAPPAGVDDESWQKVLTMLREEESAIESELGEDADLDPEDITREAAYRIETRTRQRYDSVGERLVDVIRALMDRGMFDIEAAELEPELRRAAYDLQRRVPMPQTQTQTKPQPKPQPLPVAVIDR
jgi:hypothetical protein